MFYLQEVHHLTAGSGFRRRAARRGPVCLHGGGENIGQQGEAGAEARVPREAHWRVRHVPVRAVEAGVAARLQHRADQVRRRLRDLPSITFQTVRQFLSNRKRNLGFRIWGLGPGPAIATGWGSTQNRRWSGAVKRGGKRWSIRQKRSHTRWKKGIHHVPGRAVEADVAVIPHGFFEPTSYRIGVK